MKIPFFTILNFYIAYSQQKNENSERLRMITSLDKLSKHGWIFTHFPEAVCSKRFKAGCKLYYMLDEESRPCSFAWYKIGTHHFVGEINKTVVFPKVVNCIFDCITPNGSRGKGYYPKLIKWIVNEHADYASIIYAATSNSPSNKGILKSGFIHSHKIVRFFKLIKISAINKDQMRIYVQD